MMLSLPRVFSNEVDTTLHGESRLKRRRAILLAGLVLLASPLGALAESPVAQTNNPLTEPAEQGAPQGASQGAPLAETAEPPTVEERSRVEAMDASARSPSANDIIRSLAPFADGNPNARRDVDADGRRKVRVDYGRAIDLTVFFKYDSADLTEEAKIQLAPLGHALRSRELAPYSFLIAGHTDAAGNAVYNLDLSKRRAEAVRRHLVNTFAIAPERLLTRGWGAGRLKNVDRPFSGVNRRVEVALIVPDRRSSLSEEKRLELALPLDANGWRTVGRARCAPTHLVDPRQRLSSDALDDFHSTPTNLCDWQTAYFRFTKDAPRMLWSDPDRSETIEIRD